MNDSKSKLPDLKELGSMGGKLLKDIKDSITEIIQDYKAKRNSENEIIIPEPEYKEKRTSVKKESKVQPKETKPSTKE